MHSKEYVRLMNSKRWREVRNAYLGEHPLCERCLKLHNHIVAARCVHHIIPVESGKTIAEMERLAYSTGSIGGGHNLMALCLKCHSEIHANDQSHTKAMVQKRNEERLQVWKDRYERKFGLKNPAAPV